MDTEKVGKGMVVYADVLLVLNWWIDFLLLLGVRYLVGEGSPSWRLALGALAGSLSCFVLFLPPLPVWLSLLLKLLTAAAMIRLSFRWRDRRLFMRQLLWLFGLSAGLAGVSGALYFFAAPPGFYVFNGVVYYAAPPLLLVGLTVACYGLLWALDKFLRRRAPAGRCYTVQVFHDGRRVRFLCLYDSGNHLTEPFTNRPVLVAERVVISELLPVPASAEELETADAAWRLIPYDTLGGTGLLPAFLPERVTVKAGGTERQVDCYVAVCDRLGRGEYRGLLGTALGDQLL